MMLPNIKEEKLLEIRRLCVTYFPIRGNPVYALNSVQLEVRPQEVVGILGESGCGKSTLATAILRLLPPRGKYEDGEILFRDRDLLKLREPELDRVRGREIALVAQDPALSLNPVMTVGNQIEEVLRAHIPLHRKQRRERVLELLGEMGFDRPSEIFAAYPHQLSGGQRQRVVIGQAVACQPSLIIADEPTSKLDPSLRTDVISLLSRVREQFGIAILLISHDPALFIGFADRVATMYAGRIVESGNCAETFARPLHPYTQALVQIAKSSVTDSAKRQFPFIEGDVSDQTGGRPGCGFEPRCPERMEICTCNFPPEFSPVPDKAVSCFKYAE
jgi:oligopeptide/dipeptide ABC transporter ATP-binding protein